MGLTGQQCGGVRVLCGGTPAHRLMPEAVLHSRSPTESSNFPEVETIIIPIFQGGETEARRGEATCPKPSSKGLVNRDLNPHPCGSAITTTTPTALPSKRTWGGGSGLEGQAEVLAHHRQTRGSHRGVAVTARTLELAYLALNPGSSTHRLCSFGQVN